MSNDVLLSFVGGFPDKRSVCNNVCESFYGAAIDGCYGLLNNYGNEFERLHTGRKIEEVDDVTVLKNGVEGNLSTEDVMRVAGKMFIYSSRRSIDLSFSGLTLKETQDVELALLLLAAAEKVGYREFECTSMLVKECEFMSSRIGNLVQQKIEIDTGKGSGRIQAIVEHVSKAKKVHIIDLGIKTVVQWTVLMQALVSRYECPIEILKVTTVATNGKWLIEGTGKWLLSFAQSLGLPFSFKVVVVSDMLDLKENLFEVDVGETVAVYAATTLRSMLANQNSPIFANRFVEALFFFSVYFDCLIVESVYFAEGIRNMVAAEGEERRVRHVKFDVWRAFFIRYGMEEVELSMSSLYQACLVLKTFACGRFCTLDMNGKCLLVRWKGTPVHSISLQVLSKLQDQASTRFHPCMESFDDYLSELNESFNGRCYNLSGDKIKDVSS
ncbi:hypothetical protein ES332_D09G273500v1 [Gossypium tomentosum]|uniref:Uncharacterized protein n=1 Tax=Gossypium tomentosum TaxID=34277 RepID=A0A5D2JMD3_GOSTO|nr:hypothetical protein ES332_D09G273500v1 [Gossypium tomentosum]